MAIQQIHGIKYIAQSHRCHSHVLNFLIAACSIGEYMKAYHHEEVKTFSPRDNFGNFEYPTLSFEAHASGRTVNFVPHDVLTEIFVNDSRNIAIAYTETPFIAVSGVSTGAAAPLFEGLAQAMFTLYWESNLASIQNVYGKRNQGNWPAPLQFAAVVRDAMSHGGAIHMFPSIPSVNHFSLTYSPSDNGKKIMHNDLSTGDIFSLMLDVDALF